MCIADDVSVSTSGVMIQFLHSFDDTSPGIEVYVSEKDQEVVVFVTKDGFVSVFKEMTGAVVSAVVVLSIPGKQLSHNGGYTAFAAPK